jgi:hypothetical protein
VVIFLSGDTVVLLVATVLSPFFRIAENLWELMRLIEM